MDRADKFWEKTSKKLIHMLTYWGETVGTVGADLLNFYIALIVEPYEGLSIENVEASSNLIGQKI